MTARSRLVELAVRLYEHALILLPGDFRERHRGELRACFRDLATAARGRGPLALAGTLLRALLDVALRAPWEHRTMRRRAPSRGGAGPFTGLGSDLRHAARRLGRQPAFTLATVLTLGVGLGAAIAVLSLVHGVVLRPLPYPEPDRLVVLEHAAPGLDLEAGLGLTPGIYHHYLDGNRSFTALAGHHQIEVTLTGEGDPVRLRALATSPSLGAVLGVAPAVGRWLDEDSAEPAGRTAVAVVSHALWQGRLGGDPQVVGRLLELDGEPHEILGVMPQGFAFPDRRTELWVPWPIDRGELGGFYAEGVGRLRAEVEPDAAARDLAAILPSLRETYPEAAGYLDEARITPLVIPLLDSTVGDIRVTMLTLWGAAAFLLLVSAANVANLFLVRAEDGRRDVALREALGAPGTRLLRGLLAESGLVAVGAAAVGLGLGSLALAAVRTSSPITVPRIEEIRLDPAVMAIALGGAIVLAILLALAPLVRRGRLVAGLEGGGGRRGTAGRGSQRLRRGLVTLQVALALVLLVGSALLMRSFENLRAVAPGFDPTNALTFEIGLPRSRYDEGEAARFQVRLRESLAALPGVSAATAVGHCLPLTGPCWGDLLIAEGQVTPPGQSPPVSFYRTVLPGYHAVMGTPILRGRGLVAADTDDGSHPVVISAETAKRLFADGEALGRRVANQSSGPWLTVVGVAADIKEAGLADEPRLVVYLPLGEERLAGPEPYTLHHVVRAAVPVADLVPAVRRAVAEIDPRVPLARLRTLEDLVAEETAPTAFVSLLVGLAALVTSLLGAVGIYAVVAYSVSQRQREIGVRMALGARPRDVGRLVFAQGARPVLVGLALGIAAALGGSRLLTSLLYGVSPTDLGTYATVTALLAAVAALALLLPARRASRVDPAAVLEGD